MNFTDDREKEIVKFALRGHATVYEERAKVYERQDATAAAIAILREAWVLRDVLRREFGD